MHEDTKRRDFNICSRDYDFYKENRLYFILEIEFMRNIIFLFSEIKHILRADRYLDSR